MEPGVITVLNTGNTEVPQASSGVGPHWRLAGLGRKSITARVMVNRIGSSVWARACGHTNDFDPGGRPVNQKLLDWLAVEFVERGWSVKPSTG